MIRRMIWPLVFGLGGMAILMSLGIWQVQRLAWKEGVLAEIEARIAATPEALPEDVRPGRERYMPVAADGEIGSGARPRSGQPESGRGRGTASSRPSRPGGAPHPGRPRLHADRRCAAGAEGPVTVTGNLHWPDEVDGFTPAPDLAATSGTPATCRAGGASRHRAGADRARAVGFGPTR
jgi:surfeit locus 1 family protein